MHIHGIQCIKYFIEFCFVETNQLFTSNPNVILTRQTWKIYWNGMYPFHYWVYLDITWLNSGTENSKKKFWKSRLWSSKPDSVTGVNHTFIFCKVKMTFFLKTLVDLSDIFFTIWVVSFLCHFLCAPAHTLDTCWCLCCRASQSETITRMIHLNKYFSFQTSAQISIGQFSPSLLELADVVVPLISEAPCRGCPEGTSQLSFSPAPKAQVNSLSLFPRVTLLLSF